MQNMNNSDSISKLVRGGWILLYYGFARFLPCSGSPVMGNICKHIRYACCKRIFKKIGKGVNVERMASFGNGYDVEIGDRSSIGIHCNVPNDIKIGNDVMMGPHCYVLENVTHRYNRIDIPMIFQGSKKVETRTIIGDDVWMGRQCIMISGKKIGDHCIIGAGSVICKDVPEWKVAGGSPIRIIRDRRE